MARKNFCCKSNKRFILTSSGLIIITGAAGAGISELSSGLTLQSSINSKQYDDLENASPHSLDTRSIVPLGLENNDWKIWNDFKNSSGNIVELDTKSSSSNEEETRLVSGQDPSSSEFAVTKLASSTQSSNDEVDEGYVNGLGSVSMGGKFKDDLILAPKGSQVGQQKAESLKKKTKEKPGKDGLFVINNKLYNAGNREDLEIPKIDGEKLHSLCTSILSYSDYGIWFTHISRLNYKGFFDFVWETCGREDKSKPSNGKFA